jgi:hypothetical protein
VVLIKTALIFLVLLKSLVKELEVELNTLLRLAMELVKNTEDRVDKKYSYSSITKGLLGVLF